MSGSYKRVLDGTARAFMYVDRGTLGEGMRAAIEQVERGYEEMIDGWHRA
jgi:hypothetical protein